MDQHGTIRLRGSVRAIKCLLMVVVFVTSTEANLKDTPDILQNVQQAMNIFQQMAALGGAGGQNGNDALAGLLKVAANPQMLGQLTSWLQNVGELMPMLNTLTGGKGLAAFDAWSIYQFAMKSGFIVPLDLSEECLRDVSYILEATFTSEHGGPLPMWAANMIDSFGKLPSGVISGNGNWIGDYKECTGVQVYKNESGVVYGQPDFVGEYCLVFIVNVPAEGAKLPEYYPKVGMCFPSTCTYKDKLKLSNYWITMTPVRMAVHEQFCQVKKSRPLDWHTVIAGMFVGSLVTMVLAGTLFDIWLTWMIKKNIPITMGYKTVEQLAPYLVAFSAYRNLKKMFHVEDRTDTLGAMHGMRVVTMMWVVFVHMAVMTFQDYPWRNQIDAINSLAGDLFVQLIPGAIFSTDVFLVMSGILVTYVFLNIRRDSKKTIPVPLFYFHRIWRIVPPYSVTLAILGGLIIHMGAGPLWPLIEDDVMKCQTQWWKNILFVQNLFGSFYDQCMLPSWYLSVDLQLYLATPLFLYTIAKRPRLGLFMLGVAFVLSALLPGLLTYIYDLEAYTGKQSRKSNSDLYTEMVYNKPYTRASTYLMGMFIGYILHKKGTKITMKPSEVVIGWAFALFFLFGLLFGFRDYFLGRPMSRFYHVLYAVLARPAFGFSVGWVIYACATGYGGIVNSFLSWKALAPFSRLSYCVYLIHILVVHYFYYSRQDNLYIDYYGLLTAYFGTLVISVFFAIALSLVAEVPFINMEKLMLPRGDKAEVKVERSATRKTGAQKALFTLVGRTKGAGNKTQTESDSGGEDAKLNKNVESSDQRSIKSRRR